MVYQPKVSCISGALTGVEALGKNGSIRKGFILQEELFHMLNKRPD